MLFKEHDMDIINILCIESHKSIQTNEKLLVETSENAFSDTLLISFLMIFILTPQIVHI